MTDSRGSGHSFAMSLGLLAAERDAAPEAQVVLCFDVVYAEHFAFVWRSLARLGVDEAALDDAAQEVFVVVHRRLGGFEGRSAVKTWLFGIAMRVAKDYRRWVRRKGGAEPLPVALIDGGASPFETSERAEAVRLLHELLSQLDEKKRVVFVLSELEQMSAPEIAETLGANLNTVYSRIRVARQEFERVLARHERKRR